MEYYPSRLVVIKHYDVIMVHNGHVATTDQSGIVYPVVLKFQSAGAQTAESHTLIKLGKIQVYI